MPGYMRSSCSLLISPYQSGGSLVVLISEGHALLSNYHGIKATRKSSPVGTYLAVGFLAQI